MSEKLGETPTPEGAPEVAPEPTATAFGAPERPRLGGLAGPSGSPTARPRCSTRSRTP